MDPSTLSEVQDIGLREVWEHEEYDFTPWLADHVDHLATVLGIEIEDVVREDTVGGYTADITAREVNTGDRVVIENQFGTTDHDHLGKLLTYAAGTSAEFVIWIAEEFRDEHRSVLEWLNESGPRNTKFFAVKPRVITLDEASERGFEFTTALEPNDWERAVREVSESLTERERAYRAFYVELVDAYAEARPDWNRLKPQPKAWLAFGAGIAGIRFVWSFHRGPEFAAELYIDTQDSERNDEIYGRLEQNRNEINAELGDVIWQHLPEKRACRIKQRTMISGSVEELNEAEKHELMEWGVSTMNEMRQAFGPQLQRI